MNLIDKIRDAVEKHGAQADQGKRTPGNEFVSMPDIFSTYNASTDRCDLLVGPCACGATHSADEWVLIRP